MDTPEFTSSEGATCFCATGGQIVQDNYFGHVLLFLSSWGSNQVMQVFGERVYMHCSNNRTQ